MFTTCQDRIIHLDNVDILSSHAFANLDVGLSIGKLLGNHVGVVDAKPGQLAIGEGKQQAMRIIDNFHLNLSNLSQILCAKSGWEEPEKTLLAIKIKAATTFGKRLHCCNNAISSNNGNKVHCCHLRIIQYQATLAIEYIVDTFMFGILFGFSRHQSSEYQLSLQNKNIPISIFFPHLFQAKLAEVRIRIGTGGGLGLTTFLAYCTSYWTSLGPQGSW